MDDNSVKLTDELWASIAEEDLMRVSKTISALLCAALQQKSATSELKRALALNATSVIAAAIGVDPDSDESNG